MYSSPLRILRNLLPATETVRNQNRLCAGRAYSWQQPTLCEQLRYFVFIFLKSKWPRHTTTARIEQSHIGSHHAQQVHFIVHLHYRLMMAVTLYHESSAACWRPVFRCAPHQELAQKICIRVQGDRM